MGTALHKKSLYYIIFKIMQQNILRKNLVRLRIPKLRELKSSRSKFIF